MKEINEIRISRRNEGVNLDKETLKILLKEMLSTGELYIRLDSDMNNIMLSVELDGEEVSRSDVYLSNLIIENNQ